MPSLRFETLSSIAQNFAALISLYSLNCVCVYVCVSYYLKNEKIKLITSTKYFVKEKLCMCRKPKLHVIDVAKLEIFVKNG